MSEKEINDIADEIVDNDESTDIVDDIPPSAFVSVDNEDGTTTHSVEIDASGKPVEGSGIVLQDATIEELEEYLNKAKTDEWQQKVEDEIDVRLAEMTEEELEDLLFSSKSKLMQDIVEDILDDKYAGTHYSSSEINKCWGHPSHATKFSTTPGGQVCHLVTNDAYEEICSGEDQEIKDCGEDSTGSGCFRVEGHQPVYQLKNDGSICFVPDQEMVDSPVCGGKIGSIKGCDGEFEEQKYGEGVQLVERFDPDYEEYDDRYDIAF